MQGNMRPSVSTFHLWYSESTRWFCTTAVNSAQSTVHTVQSAELTVHSAELTIHNAQFTIHKAQFTIESAQCTQYTVDTVDNWEFTVHSGQRLIPNAALGLVAVCPLLGIKPPPISSGHEYHQYLIFSMITRTLSISSPLTGWCISWSNGSWTWFALTGSVL